MAPDGTRGYGERMTVRSRTLLVVGILLVLSVVTPLLLPNAGVLSSLVPAVLMAGAVVVGAIGLRSGESLVLRMRSLVTLFIVWALLIVAPSVVWLVAGDAFDGADRQQAQMTMAVVSYITLAIRLVSVVLAVLCTAALRHTLVAVPSWARTLPLLTTLVVAAVALLTTAVPLLLTVASAPNPAVIQIGASLSIFASLAVLGLGIVSILLSTKAPIDVTTEVVHLPARPE